LNADQQVNILLATYNGGKYLAQQLASLQAQTLSNWVLLVRDDGSTDNTRDILDGFAADDRRITIIRDDNRNLGVARNFALLAEAASTLGAPFFAFCDQDDVWVPTKLQVQVQTARDLTRQYGGGMPILVHSDLAVVGSDLTPVHPSFMRYQGIPNPGNPELPTVVFQNHVVGCTALGNRALLELALPQPDGVYMHDWWIAICAKAAGMVEYVPERLVSYRQHGSNQVGAGGIRQALRPRAWRRVISKLARLEISALKQAQALHERLMLRCPEGKTVTSCHTLADIARLPYLRPMQRWATLRRHNIHAQNALLTMFLYASLFHPAWMHRARARLR